MIRTTLLLLLTVFALAPIHAQQRKLVDSRITDVTVFLSGAQVTHQGDFNLKAGENIFTISNLPLYMDPNSVQVEGNSAYTILSVRHQVNYLTDQRRNPRSAAIQDSLEDAQFKLKELIALKSVVNQEKLLFEANRNIKGSAGALVPEDLEDMADFYSKRFKQMEFKLLELGENEKEANAEIARLQNQLNAMNARISQNPSEVVVTLSAQKEGKASFKMSYFAQQAGWMPVYDLRAEDINKEIEFSYRARVFQSTGNDWNKVNLTISTGNPTVGGQIPEMGSWFVYIYNPAPVGKPTYSRNKAEMAPMADGAYDSNLEGEITYETTANYTTVQSNAVNTEFKISIPYDIPSDNQQYDVTMQRENLKADYRYVTIPKLDNDAFLRAQVVNWMQYALLPGESNIYFRGTYVGKGYIDPTLANDTLNLSLGRDRSIQVKREQIKDFCKTSTFGGKQKTTRAYEITVTNTKKQSVQLEIIDQLPISQSSEVEVEQEEISGATVDSKTGKVVWNVTIEPGQTVKKQLRFNVTYPKKKYVGNL